MKRTEQLNNLRNELSKVKPEQAKDNYYKKLIKKYANDKSSYHIVLFSYAQHLFWESKYSAALKHVVIILSEYSNYPFIKEYASANNLAGIIWDIKQNAYLSYDFF